MIGNEHAKVKFYLILCLTILSLVSIFYDVENLGLTDTILTFYNAYNCGILMLLQKHYF
jgi:hypothetical protein